MRRPKMKKYQKKSKRLRSKRAQSVVFFSKAPAERKRGGGGGGDLTVSDIQSSTTNLLGIVLVFYKQTVHIPVSSAVRSRLLQLCVDASHTVDDVMGINNLKSP